MHPHFAGAFAFLRRADLAQLPCGRYEIAGPDCWATISEVSLRPFSDENAYEVHRTFIDIHSPLSGKETIGFMRTPPEALAGFDAEKDCAVFTARGEAKELSPGDFAVFFPETDAHSPGHSTAGVCAIRKVVVKIRA